MCFWSAKGHHAYTVNIYSRSYARELMKSALSDIRVTAEAILLVTLAEMSFVTLRVGVIVTALLRKKHRQSVMLEVVLVVSRQ